MIKCKIINWYVISRLDYPNIKTRILVEELDSGLTFSVVANILNDYFFKIIKDSIINIDKKNVYFEDLNDKLVFERLAFSDTTDKTFYADKLNVMIQRIF